ncbi:MAG: site-specific integrase [Verrucomicrobiales bacterium]|nr:site-specific integrase [Verrucomicrobiales bacterium]
MKIQGLGKNSHGLYWFRPSRKGLPAGTRPKPINLGTRDEDEAIAKVLDLRNQGTLAPAGQQTIQQLVDAYMAAKTASRKHRQKTTQSMKQRLHHFAKWFAGRAVRELTRADIQRWYAGCANGRRSNSTLHQFYRYVRAFLNWLVEMRIIRENPASRLAVPAPSQSRRELFCTTAQRDAIVNACVRDDLRFVLLAGFFMGLRINEIVNCRWSWFSSDLSVCTVQNSAGFTTKSGRERTMPVHSKVREFLQRQPRGDGYILAPKKVQGKNWLRWDPVVPFKLLVRECGLPWVSFHVMRHTFGSLHAMAGTPEIKIRRWMGITQATWERHYAGLAPDDAAIEAI